VNGLRRLLAFLLLLGGAAAFALLSLVPPWTRHTTCLVIAAGYLGVGIAVACGVYFARAVGIGLGLFGVLLVLLKQVRLFGLAPYFALGHVLLAVSLAGEAMVAAFPRLRLGLSGRLRAEVDSLVTAAAVLMPFLYWNGFI
jgi:hypothetical protein